DRGARAAGFQMCAYQQRARAACPLAILDPLESPRRRGEHRRGRRHLASTPPQRAESHQRLAGPYRIALGDERLERPLQPPSRLAEAPEPELGQRRERLRLGALVTHAERDERGRSLAGFLERLGMRGEPEEDLGAIEA